MHTAPLLCCKSDCAVSGNESLSGDLFHCHGIVTSYQENHEEKAGSDSEIETPPVTPRNLAGHDKVVRAFLHLSIGPSEQHPRLEFDVLTFFCDTNLSSTLAEGSLAECAHRNGEKNSTDVRSPPITKRLPFSAGLTGP